METVDGLKWQVMRSTQDASILLEHMGRHMQSAGETASAQMFLAKARELNQQVSQFQKIAVGHVSLGSNSLEQQSAD